MAKNQSNINDISYYRNFRRDQGTSRLFILKSPDEEQSFEYSDDVVPAICFKPYQRFLKRMMDIVLSLLSLIIVIPLILIAAICIKLDSPGPMFFTQIRAGQHGRLFKIYKLRSMVFDAPEQRQSLESLNETNGVIFKIKADPRITRLGRLLRKYSIDELPQVFNVIKGDMSLTGPRPLPIENIDNFKKHHFNRLKVPQGITGVWQTDGRSDMTDFEAIYDMERMYIETWSLVKDLIYIAKTFAVVFSGKGAC